MSAPNAGDQTLGKGDLLRWSMRLAAEQPGHTLQPTALVNEAYLQLNVQGYVQKSNDFSVMKQNIKTILDYWSLCKHSNNTIN